MIGFQEFLIESKEALNEKLILLSNGKRYGQIAILSGGAGSGKGFASSNFMEIDKFKVRDVDEWKTTFGKIADIKNNPEKWAKLSKAGTSFSPEKLKEIKGLNLKNPADVFKLHSVIDQMGIKDRSLNLLVKGMKNRETLPNILFDITAKDVKSIHKILPQLLNAGYNPANIHMIWVLTDYQVAIKNNAGRDRVVPDDIMLQTHKGAANTMVNYITGVGKKLAINGSVQVILNNKANTIFWEPGDIVKGKVVPNNSREKPAWLKSKKSAAPTPIGGFTYITVKERGKPFKTDKDLKKTLFHWVGNNIPIGELKSKLADLQDGQDLILKPNP